MAPRSHPTVALVSASGTLPGIDGLLRKAGVRLIRVPMLQIYPTPPSRWLHRARSITPDTVVVTSRAAVDSGIVPWRRARRSSLDRVEFWAAGPGTAQALRSVGIRRVRRPDRVGAQGMGVALRRHLPRNVLYFRSDLAGRSFAATLKKEGHRVVDLVVYRVRAGTRLSVRTRQDILNADLLVVTSPSALDSLRRGTGRVAYLRLQEIAHLVVLGPRSRAAARRLGFRRVSVAPSTTAQGFTRHLLRELRDAPP